MSKRLNIPANARARDIVLAIEDWAEKRTVDTHEVRMLWNFLTALRGPDSGDWVLKEHTTSRIRQVVERFAWHGGAKVNGGLVDKSVLVPDHFSSHIRYAGLALMHMGLNKGIWDAE